MASLMTPGCLNPRPEEDPSVDAIAVTPGENPNNAADPSSGSTRDDCGQNPYLAGCDQPDLDADEPGPNAPEAPPAPVDATENDEPRDAGADAAADAQTP